MVRLLSQNAFPEKRNGFASFPGMMLTFPGFVPGSWNFPRSFPKINFPRAFPGTFPEKCNYIMALELSQFLGMRPGTEPKSLIISTAFPVSRVVPPYGGRGGRVKTPSLPLNDMGAKNL